MAFIYISLSATYRNILNELICSDKCNYNREPIYSFERINYSLLVFRKYKEEPLHHHLQG